MMILEQAIRESGYGEATLLTANGMRYSVDSDGIVTAGSDGMPASIIDALPEDVAQSDRWEAVGEAES